MAEMVEQTSQGKTVTKFFSGFVSPQMVFLLCGAFVSVVIFWKTSKDNWDKVKQLEQRVENKAETSELKALNERVSRQYETSNKIQDRVVDVEKKQEYERGKADGEREERRRATADSRSGN